tara:strand:- start:5113 stop:5583 length:471 start_codon:yes stop_codon:yes gene_type:complete
MSSDDFDVDDYIIADLPQDCSKETFEEQYLCDLPQDTSGYTAAEEHTGASMREEQPDDPRSCSSKVTRNSDIAYLEQSSVKIPYITVEHMTQDGNQNGGAILLKLTDLSTGEVVEKWIPKKLCCNLQPSKKYIYVWDVFAQQHLSKFYGEQDETPE